MEKKEKRKSKFAMLWVTEKEDGVIKQHIISSRIIESVAIILFLLVVVVICTLVYNNITISNLRNEVVTQLVAINNLTDENEALSVDNNSLSNKISVLSETVSKKAATEDEMSQEAIEDALPKGFPLSGSATMTEENDGDPLLVFKAAEGINVITTGNGTVLSVDADETYGTRITIDHGNGYCSIYRNSGTPLVKTGDVLGKGYILFSIGEENGTLGYQITYEDACIDPMDMIEING